MESGLDGSFVRDGATCMEAFGRGVTKRAGRGLHIRIRNAGPVSWLTRSDEISPGCSAVPALASICVARRCR